MVVNMSNLKSITITKGYVIDVGSLSPDEWAKVEKQLIDNEITTEELETKLDIDVDCKCTAHYEATIFALN